MKRRSVVSLVALAALAVIAMGAKPGTQTSLTYTDGKALADSFAAAADPLSGLVIPTGCDTIRIMIAADSIIVCQLQVSPDNSKWFTAATDSNAASSVKVIAIPNVYPSGWYFRLNADNATATTSYAKTAVTWEF